MTRTELFTLLKESKINFGFDVRYGERVEISLKDLTAFIDEYFLPRPLFEDGTPVKVGDRFLIYEGINGEVDDFYVCDDGSFAINDFQYDQDQRVKKPKQPEALDADGVPIKVGDKIYFVGIDGAPLKCVGFSNDGLVKVTNCHNYKGLTPVLIEANKLTHCKPDSWEQLEEDAMLPPFDYCRKRDIEAKVGFASKSKAKDIIHRAKALAGVDDE